MSVPDKIEREILINAGLGRVWELVSEPGWWIGDGEDVGLRRSTEGGLEIIDHPRFGRFPVKVEAVEPQRYLAYRWASAFRGAEPVGDKSTLVEFWLTEQDGGVLLRVVESGFAALATSQEDRQREFEGNTDGWRQQLDLVKSRAVPASA
ncbi:MAG TPA: SRPBCC domain-containing protein [Pseudonocardiaceae bacterium]|jgi:uncharacterized protein YndB with AHSA1/START domain|nr:SRPBCC domain-containing protein [Pseudonocardiaceae bacterium]